MERSQIEKQRIMTNLLNVIDELELALNSGERVKNKKVLLEGIQMTLKKMYSILEKEGLKKIDAVGKTFDPKLHEVVTKVPTKKHREGIIIEGLDVGDVDDDGIAEVCAGTDLIHVLQWNGSTYVEEAVLPTFGDLAVLNIGDCDNDGKNEIHAGSVIVDIGEDFMAWIFKYGWVIE